MSIFNNGQLALPSRIQCAAQTIGAGVRTEDQNMRNMSKGLGVPEGGLDIRVGVFSKEVKCFPGCYFTTYKLQTYLKHGHGKATEYNIQSLP